MEKIKFIYTGEEWHKVRELADKWYTHAVWYIPTKVYYVIMLIGFVVALTSSEYKNLALIVAAIAGAEIYSREKQIKSYIDGWQHAQDYIKGELTIDELLEFDKPPAKSGAR